MKGLRIIACGFGLLSGEVLADVPEKPSPDARSAAKLLERTESDQRSIGSGLDQLKIPISEVLDRPSGTGTSARIGQTDDGANARDPFSVSPAMLEESKLKSEGLRFTPMAGAQVPQLKLRGIINAESEDRLGLIEVVREGVFLVREGDTISLRSAASNTVIKITEIGALSVVVEAGTLGEVIVVR